MMSAWVMAGALAAVSWIVLIAAGVAAYLDSKNNPHIGDD